jgi:FtsP/CotA-like multicopper oxidase with cupredoxin domain
MYGPLSIEDPADGKDYDDELVLVLADWIDGTGTTPDDVAAKLKKTGMTPMAAGGTDGRSHDAARHGRR